MNVEIRPIRTAAETALATNFATVKRALPGAAAVTALREAAFHRFETEGLPHRRVEEWNIPTCARSCAMPSRSRTRPMRRRRRALSRRWPCSLRSRRALSSSSMASLRRNSPIWPTWKPASPSARWHRGSLPGDPHLVAHLGKLITTDDVAVALNTAFMGDGAVIRVAEGAALARPIHLVFVNAGKEPASVFVRSLVVIENGARAMLVESHIGTNGDEDQVNAALELKVGDAAHVDHIKITGRGAGALHVSTLMATVGAHARFNEFLFTTGGAVVRNQLFVRFSGEGTIAGIRGASLLKGRQHADTTLVADHAVADCTSREVFKSVLDDEGRSVFQGKIIVRRHAQKTDAKMATHALLLSDTAEADNKPELEIFADDVQCGHGATSGDLDEDSLFYLRARGIPAKEAEALLIQAFVGEAVEGIEHAGLRDALMDQVVAWLAARK